MLLLWWLSFATDEGPRGVALVRAADFISAVKVAHVLGINPGGEVAGEVFDVAMQQRLSFELPVERLLPPKEAQELADRIDREIP